MEKLINSLLSSADAEAFRDPVDWRGLGLDDYPHVIKRPMDLGTVKLRLARGAYPTAEACAADVRLIWENCRTYNTGGVPRNLHKAANALSKRFEARFAKMPASGRLKTAASGNGGSNSGGGGGGGGGGSGSGSKKAKGGGNAKSGAADAPPPPANEDRRRLARHLGRARMEDVTAAVHEIDRRCPTALVLKRARRGGAGKEGDGGGCDGGDDLATLTGTAAIEIEVDVDELDPWTFCAVERVVGLSSASAIRRTKKKKNKRRPVAGVVAASSSSSKRSSGGGFRHGHPHQERGGAGTAAAAVEGAGVKGGRGDRVGAAGAVGGAVVGPSEVRPCKKSKVGAGTSL